MSWTAVPVAFFAGMVSFLAPCVLPLVPAYLSAVSAVDADRLGERGSARRVVSGSVPFVLGFTAFFVLLGVGAALVGGRILGDQFLLERIAGFVLVVFGLAFWEVEAGGPAARIRVPARTTPDFQFPQDDNPQLASRDWRPQVWDYIYVALTNGIAFSPTDVMPLSLRAKAMMGLESALSAVTVLLVAARAVNILGS